MLSIDGWTWEGNDNIMMWQVNDSANVDGSPSVYTYLQANYSDDEFGVRIAVYDSSGNLLKYCNPVYGDYPEPGQTYIDYEFNDQYVGTKDDFGLTVASQAYYGPDDYYEKLFQMQIGNYDGDYNFYPILYSSRKTVTGHWYDMGTLLPPTTDWTPTDFYTYNPPIPEPSSSLLVLIGISFLGLKRKFHMV